ncbi:aminotransferase class III [Candidatus Desantisbacteria bacterium CG_4_8_14_3_um_filter_40_12]|uniref:Aminotransferase class III n=1 Tax=Candidatus Desantisbacteria bacterium CG_4_8_14_3_um_filter_40_12 TaxID=1974545 RepID=A0A2M7JDG1_9BACT|nr:MAG: aminotransferase class III [Candidatus Desantisbacteria bacterium CG_4_8_14_3_um_filter_40_12]
MGISQDLYNKAKKLISGGTQLLSKRPEMFLPDLWPAYYKKAKGCEIWDLDGNKYIDASFMGIGACILGYADEDVDNAVKDAIDNGAMSTLNCPEEVELAELLCQIHPWADMVRYARTGGEAMAIAVRIARAKTGKDLILFCGYHGWHDWYLSANLADDKALDGHLLPGLEPKGVPRVLKGTAIPFVYNDSDTFLKLIKEYGEKAAAVVMEPIRNFYPEKGFLELIREKTKELGIVLIFDEVTSGWRLTIGGAHLNLGVEPDIAVFAKAISNGYPMAAIIGKSEVMEVAQESFISSTYWTEKIGPTASLATIKKLRERNVPALLAKIGKKVQDGWKKSAEKYNLGVKVFGIPPLSHFHFECGDHLILKTLYTQLMLEKGFLAADSFYASYAHKEEDTDKYLNATEEAFEFISKAVREGTPQKYLKGPVCHSGFRRLA